MLDKLEEVRKRVATLASMRVRKFFHSASNTHIFFQPDVGVDGIRGTAAFSDLAFREFNRNLLEWVKRADESSLALAEERMRNSSPDVRQVKEFQVRVPERIKEALKTSAEKEGIPLSSLIVRVIRDQLAEFSSVKDARSAFKSSRNRLRNEQKTDLSFRAEESSLQPLTKVARASRCRETEVIRSLIMNHFSEQARKESRRAAVG